MRRRATVVPLERNTDADGKVSDPVSNTNDAAVNASLAPQFMNHSDIKRKTIQVFYTDEGNDHRPDFLADFLTVHFLSCLKVLHPNEKFRSTFDFITVIWVLVLVYMVPFQIGFDWYKLSKFAKTLMHLLDLWFAVDILLNFRTGYIHHGTIIMNPKKIVKHYVTTWFIVDFLGTFPFELFVNGESASSRKSLKLIKYFKIPKLLRISRLMKYIRDHKFVYDIFQVFVLVFTSIHIGACVWMLILSPCIDSDEIFDYIDLCAQENVNNLYAESFHLSATMMLGVSNSHIIGDSTTLDMLTEKRDIDRGKMYAVSTLFMVGGLFLVALLISELNVFVFGKMQGSATFQRKIDRVKHELEYYSVPDALQLKVKAFYDYVWIHQKQYDDRIALLSDDQMSTDLQRKLALHLFKDVVSHISIFSEIDDLLLGEICLSLRTRIFLPGDMILFKGDIGKELFIIAKGVVEVLRDDLPVGQRHKTPTILLKNGSFFGEIALIMETRRTCSVQARTICEVNILQQRTFDTILRENPDFALKMNELVVARQLERSLSKTANDRVEFQVSTDDMTAALHVVEKNMKEGLNRRMREERLSLSSSRNDSFQGELKSRASRLPISVRSNDMDDYVTRDQPTILGGRDADADATTQIIDDIARRSTQFANGETPRQRSASMPIPQKPAVKNRSYSDGISNSVSVDWSKSESRMDLRTKTIPAPCPFSIIDGDGEDTETMLVTGHYNPDRVKVDISRVRPSLLNRGDHSSILTRLERKLVHQEEMITHLVNTVNAFTSGLQNGDLDKDTKIAPL